MDRGNLYKRLISEFYDELSGDIPDNPESFIYDMESFIEESFKTIRERFDYLLEIENKWKKIEESHLFGIFVEEAKKAVDGSE